MFWHRLWSALRDVESLHLARAPPRHRAFCKRSDLPVTQLLLIDGASRVSTAWNQHSYLTLPGAGESRKTSSNSIGNGLAGFFAVFVGMGQQRPLPPAHTTVAPPESPRSTSDLNQRYYGETPGRPARGSGAGLEEPGARGSTVWGAKLCPDRSPRHGRRVKGQTATSPWLH